MDNKEPIVISLFTLKALIDEGSEPKRRIRILMGCDEENGRETRGDHHIHGADEYIGLEQMVECAYIYAEAMKALAEEKENSKY